MIQAALRFAVLADRPQLFAWEQLCIGKLEQSGLATLALVVEEPRSSPEEDSMARLIRDLAGDVETHFPVTPLKALVATGLSELPLDFCLVFGSPKSRFQHAPRCRGGAWTFAVSDMSRFSTTVPCFWEMMNDEAVTGAFLLRLRDQSKQGNAIRRGYFPVAHDSLRQSIESVFRFLPDWPTDVSKAWCEQGDDALETPPLPPAPARYGLPNADEIRRFRALESRTHRRLMRERRHYLVDWNIARLNAPPAAFVGKDERATVEVLQPSRKRRYIADPCIISVDERRFVFCEDYPYGSEIGFISAFEIKNKSCSPPVPVIVAPFHLSYPQVFEHKGVLYCMPESGSAHQVTLYRAQEFPGKWIADKTLIDQFAAVDSTLLQAQGKWWLFCTSGERGFRAFNSHLYVWHADDLFGPWSPHPRNPVKIDVRSARPAGQIFQHEGAWYRPAQDCSRRYGGAITINRIDVLDERRYEETVVGTIRPPIGKYDKGIHTISSINGETIVDVQRTVFEPRTLVTAAWQTLRGAALAVGFSEGAIAGLKRRLKRDPASA